MEVLKDLTIFPSYRFADTGRIFSKRSGRFLTPLVTPRGYRHVVLCERGKKERVSVHRLIATAFHGQPPTPSAVVNHKNNVRSDNRAVNLEWCTQAENVSHAYATGRRLIDAAHRARCALMGRSRRSFTDKQAQNIRAEYTGKRGQITALAARYGLSRHAVASILKGA